MLLNNKNSPSISPSKLLVSQTNSTLSAVSSSDTLLEEELFTTTTTSCNNKLKLINSNQQQQIMMLNGATHTKQNSPGSNLQRNSSINNGGVKPTLPVRRNSSMSSTHNTYLYSKQSSSCSSSVYVENNYDDIQNIQKYNINVNRSIIEEVLSPQIQVVASPPPPPPPPPPLPTPSRSNYNEYDSLPPPPASFYSDDAPQPPQPPPATKSTTPQTSVHQVLMAQIQYGVKLKPVLNRHNN